MNIMKNKKGVTFVGTLLFTVLLLGMSAVFLLRAVNEANLAKSEREETGAFYAAQGGGQAALNQMDTLINTYLQNTIVSTNPSVVISNANSKVSSGDGIGWLVSNVKYNNAAVLTQNDEQAEYTQNAALGNANYTYKIIMTEKSDPTTVGTNAWDFLYSYRIESKGSLGGAGKEIYISGDFTVRVQKDNFAKYALFTNVHTMQSGTYVWFTDKTNFAGPVHTNDRLSFAKNPSGTFYSTVTQVQQTARFYNNGSPILLNANNNSTIDVPTFYSGFTRNASSITLSSPTTQQDVIDQAKGGQTFSSNGIYVPNNGTTLSGGIYVKGDGNISLSVVGGNPVYTVSQGSATKKVTVNYSTSQTTVEDVSAGSSQTYSSLPDGIDNAGTIIHVDGNISSVSGTVQSATELTISSSNDIVISNHLRYSSYTPGSGTPGTSGYVPPNADGTTNLLGLVSWGGNVRVGTSAPNNVEVHGSILAQNGVFQVDNYNDQSVGSRGTATLLGGVISNNYGAFGLFNGTTGQQIAGYGRNFVYDGRFQQGKAPPYFPSLSTFIAFTNDITDQLVWQEDK